MNRNGKTTIAALFAMFRAASGKCLDYLQKGEEKTIPWGKWAKYGLCVILLALFVPMCVKGYLLMWEERQASNMAYGFSTGIYLCLLVLLAVLSMKRTPVSKPSWVWEALFWIILLFLAGISAIVCFAFVTTLRVLCKSLRRHPQNHKAENIPKSQSLDQEEIQVLDEEAWQDVSFGFSSIAGLWARMDDFLARGICFFQRNPFHTAMIVTGLVILGAYWQSLPDYPLLVSYDHDRSRYYANGLKPKQVDDKYGYVNMYGEIVIAPIYDEVAPENPFFFMGKRPARIKINGK
jgi:hypothetical protein